MKHKDKRVEYPFHKCISCEGLIDCPEPGVLEDGFGTVVAPEECPFKDQRIVERKTLINGNS